MPKVRIIKNDGNTRELLGVYYFDDITGIDNVKTKNGVNYLEVVDKSEIPMNAEKIDDIPKFAQKDSNKHTVEAHRKKLQEKYREIKELMSKTNVSEYDFDYSEIDKATNAKKNKRLEIVVEALNTKISELNRLIKEEQKFWGDIAGNIESSEDEMTAVSRPEKIHDSTSRDDIADYSKFLNVLKSVLDKQENLSPENINKFEKIIEEKILTKFNNDPEYKRKINDIEVTTPIKGGGSKTCHEKEKESFQKYIKRLMEEGKIKVDGYTSNKFPIYDKLEYIEFLDKLNKTIEELVVEEDKEDKNDKADADDKKKEPIKKNDVTKESETETVTKYTWYGTKTVDRNGHCARAISNPLKSRSEILNETAYTESDPEVVSTYRLLRKIHGNNYKGEKLTKRYVADHLTDLTSAISSHSRDFIAADGNAQLRGGLTPLKGIWYERFLDNLTGMSTRRRLQEEKFVRAGGKITYGKFKGIFNKNVENKAPVINRDLSHIYIGNMTSNEGITVQGKASDRDVDRDDEK